VFPLIDSDFELNKGKFKAPLLFGQVDTAIAKYEDIESTYRNDIDNWLSNLYFVLQRRDTLANPYSVQLVLDDDTKKEHDQLTKADSEKSITEQPKSELLTRNPSKV
jgi:hypothetical protein